MGANRQKLAVCLTRHAPTALAAMSALRALNPLFELAETNAYRLAPASPKLSALAGYAVSQAVGQPVGLVRFVSASQPFANAAAMTPTQYGQHLQLHFAAALDDQAEHRFGDLMQAVEDRLAADIRRDLWDEVWEKLDESLWRPLWPLVRDALHLSLDEATRLGLWHAVRQPIQLYLAGVVSGDAALMSRFEPAVRCLGLAIPFGLAKNCPDAAIIICD